MRFGINDICKIQSIYIFGSVRSDVVDYGFFFEKFFGLSDDNEPCLVTYANPSSLA